MESENAVLRQDMKPNDKCYIVYLIYLLYGIGILLPWNILLSCMDFLEEKVCRSSIVEIAFIDA